MNPKKWKHEIRKNIVDILNQCKILFDEQGPGLVYYLHTKDEPKKATSFLNNLMIKYCPFTELDSIGLDPSVVTSMDTVCDYDPKTQIVVAYIDMIKQTCYGPIKMGAAKDDAVPNHSLNS